LRRLRASRGDAAVREKPVRRSIRTLRLDAEVVEAYRRQGRDWQTPINVVLRAHMNDPRK
jgi:uncharacterized protein (DUF4415 family)